MTGGKVAGWILGIGAVIFLVFGPGAAALFALTAGGLAGYFLPAIIAVMRGHPNKTSIIVLNLLLGWTVIGWVVSIVWAVSAIPEAQPNTNNDDYTPSFEQRPAWDAMPEQDPAPPRIVGEHAPLANSTLPALKKCPYCAEEIKQEAIKCKHCASEIPA